jgi:hypothetical protein
MVVRLLLKVLVVQVDETSLEKGGKPDEADSISCFFDFALSVCP